MKIFDFIRLTSIALSFCLFAGSVEAVKVEDGDQSSDVQYIKVSCSKNQICGLEEKVVQFNQVDSIKGLQLKRGGKIVIKEDGVYFISVIGEAGISGVTSEANVNIWINKNENRIPHTTITQYLGSSNAVNVIKTETVIPLEKDDEITIGYSATAISTGLIAEHEPDQEPIPSAILSMFKI